VQLQNAANRLAEVLNQDGQTALHIVSSRYGDEADPDMVKYLTKQKGIPINAKDHRQWIPLHCACLCSASPAIIKALVNAGADITAPNVDGTRPVDYFVRHSPKDGNADQFEQALDLLLKGNSINLKNPSSGETAVHNAIRSGHANNLQTIRMLLARGADVSLVNAAGETPLHYAVKAGRPDIVDLLLNAGADPRQGEGGIGSPLSLAEALPESEKKKYLLLQLKKQASLFQAQETLSPRQLLVTKLEEAKEERHFAERMLQAKEEEIASLNAQVAEEQRKEQELQAEVERLKLLHQSLLAQRKRV